MESETTLPLDILESIISVLAAGDDEDTKSLQILSQACKYILPLCRRHLFSSLQLDRQARLKRFSELILPNPDVVRYARNLKYLACTPIHDYEYRILELLNKLCTSLWSIDLLSRRGSSWNGLPGPIQSSLLSLLQLPTITHLSIKSFTHFPSTPLLTCGNLTDLVLEDFEMQVPDVKQVILRRQVPRPTSLSAEYKAYRGLAALMEPRGLIAGDPVIDFSYLQRAFFDLSSPGDIGYVTKLLKVTHQLPYLNITMNRPVQLTGLGVGLSACCNRSLRSMTFVLIVAGDDYDPLCGLSHELSMMAGNNILAELKLDVRIETDGLCRTESEDWSEFDSVLAKAGAFPMLHRVSVEIWWYLFERDANELDNILGRLTAEKFPRLLESTVVEIDFSVQHEFCN